MIPSKAQNIQFRNGLSRVHLVLYITTEEEVHGIKSGNLGGHAMDPLLPIYHQGKVLCKNFQMNKPQCGDATPYCNVINRLSSLICGTMYNSGI
jgi:hypothetical protein